MHVVQVSNGNDQAIYPELWLEVEQHNRCGTNVLAVVPESVRHHANADIRSQN